MIDYDRFETNTFLDAVGAALDGSVGTMLRGGLVVSNEKGKKLIFRSRVMFPSVEDMW